MRAKKADRGFFHIIQLWTVSRGADISSLFALPGQQPLVFRQAPCANREWACIASYDYIWTYDPPACFAAKHFPHRSPGSYLGEGHIVARESNSYKYQSVTLRTSEPCRI
jgi:hypothetical protein